MHDNDDRSPEGAGAGGERLVLLTRAGCHSCDAALLELEEIAAAAGMAVGVCDVVAS